MKSHHWIWLGAAAVVGYLLYTKYGTSGTPAAMPAVAPTSPTLA